MKIETILNAMAATYYSVSWPANLWEDDELPASNVPNNVLKHRRQYRAFRARILRQFEQYEIYHGFHMGDLMMIETITEKDARIAELNSEINKLRNEIGTWEDIDDLAFDWMEEEEAQDD